MEIGELVRFEPEDISLNYGDGGKGVSFASENGNKIYSVGTYICPHSILCRELYTRTDNCPLCEIIEGINFVISTTKRDIRKGHIIFVIKTKNKRLVLDFWKFKPRFYMVKYAE